MLCQELLTRQECSVLCPWWEFCLKISSSFHLLVPRISPSSYTSLEPTILKLLMKQFQAQTNQQSLLPYIVILSMNLGIFHLVVSAMNCWNPFSNLGIMFIIHLLFSFPVEPFTWVLSAQLARIDLILPPPMFWSQEFCNWLTVYEVLSDPVTFQAWFCFGIPRSLRLPVLCSWHSQSPSLSCQLFQFTHWSKLGKIESLNDLLIRRLVDHCFDWIAAAVLRQVYFEAINWFGLTCQHFLFIFAFLSTVASLWRGECHIALHMTLHYSRWLLPCSCD